MTEYKITEDEIEFDGVIEAKTTFNWSVAPDDVDVTIIHRYPHNGRKVLVETCIDPLAPGFFDVKITLMKKEG